MELSSKENSPKDHITSIFKEFEKPHRACVDLSNFSNSFIKTSLSGQCKFLFEILQNAEDAFDDQSKYRDIKLQLISLDDYLIIQHNGKVFDYNDVERICSYSSQIVEVKSNDLSKTGYKGLGFKSLFNLSDCIYIYSNSYSFRFDKNFWPDPEKKLWTVIPIWCDSLPLYEKYKYDQPVNFIVKVNDKKQLNNQLKELIDHPEVLLYLHRVNSVYLNLNGCEDVLEKKVEKYGIFHKIFFLKNQREISTWLARTYEQAVPPQLEENMQEVSSFIYPGKIKNAEEVYFTFAIHTNETFEVVDKTDGLCYAALPTQAKLSLPYHVNSLFILIPDRTQFHENEWNEFLVHQIGFFQLSFLKDLASMPHLKNFVIDLLVRKTNYSCQVFNEAFSKGFEKAKKEIAWLPAYKGHLLKLGEACIDEIHFFKQNFHNIQDSMCDFVIDYDVKRQDLASEGKYFNYDLLFKQFPQKYYLQLTDDSYIKFLSYIYKISQEVPLGPLLSNLKTTRFLKTKNGSLISPSKALLEKEGNPVPDFADLNPVDNRFLPASNRNEFENWLVELGAEQLTPIKIIRKSVFQWVKSPTLHSKINVNNHKAIIDYLAKNFERFTFSETRTLKEKLLVLTKSNKFEIATSCYLPNVITLGELGEIISEDKIISSCYDIYSLRDFFSHLGISDKLSPIEVFRKCILVWIQKNEIRSKFTIENYEPILKFLSSEYQKIEYFLTDSEKKLLGNMPILTCTETFVEANLCYFDTAVLDVKGFEDIIIKTQIISTKNLSYDIRMFLSSIGVKEKVDPKDVIRKIVLKWIQNGTVKSRINLSNHNDILKYVAEHWHCSTSFKEVEINALKKLPILTKSNIFSEACTCYWQIMDGESNKKIPKLESIFSPDELVSSEYYEFGNEEFSKIRKLLNDLGVRYLKFTDIYDRYCDHLTDLKTVEWFFTNLIEYWKKHRLSVNNNNLLTALKVKLHSSRLLAKNGIMYLPTELHSSRFSKVSFIDENALPLLAYKNLVPEDLEKWLGIKQELEMTCIIKLLEAVDKRVNLGEEVTLSFFKIVLDQLQLKEKTEIENYPLKLLSNNNKLTFAKDLFYFIEEDSTCLADSCYLKRIHGMSHSETLKLAGLCGVNLLQFNQEIDYGEQACDNNLREFYFDRLPLIVLKESKKLNESPYTVLNNLFSKFCSIELYKCQNILIKYPFGEPVETRYHFDQLKIYVVGKWKNLRTSIYTYMKKKLELESEITDILDLESVAEDKIEWLRYQKEDPQKLLALEEELEKLIADQETDYMATDKDELKTEVISNSHLSLGDNIGFVKAKTTTVNHSRDRSDFRSTESGVENANQAANKTDYSKNRMTLSNVEAQSNQVENASAIETTGNCQDGSGCEFRSTDSEVENANQAANKTDYSKNRVTLSNIEVQSNQVENASAIETTGNSQDRSGCDFRSTDSVVENPNQVANKTDYSKNRVTLSNVEAQSNQVENASAIETTGNSQDGSGCEFRSTKNANQAANKTDYSKNRVTLSNVEAQSNQIENASAIETTGNSHNRSGCDFRSAESGVENANQAANKTDYSKNRVNVSNVEAQSNQVENISSTDNSRDSMSSLDIEVKDNSKNSSDYRPCLSRSYISTKPGCSKVRITGENSSSQHQDVIQIIYSNKPTCFIKKFRECTCECHTGPCRSSQNITVNESYLRLKRLGEQYVFIYLQDYYKAKYREAQFSLEHGHFTIQRQLHTLEIIWLNESEDKRLGHDLLLKENDEIIQFIEVESINRASIDSFHLINCSFMRKKQSAVEHPECNGKYCVYFVLYEVDSSTLPDTINVNELYKIMPLK